MVGEGEFEAAWRKLLSDGVMAGTSLAEQRPKLRAEAVAGATGRVQARAVLGPRNLEVVFREDRKVYDGRFANNGWLQETPDIMTKVCWDNVVLMGPETAAALGVTQGQMVEVERAGARIAGPAYILPGQAEYSLGVSLGYGRKAAGDVGNGVGFDAYALRTTAALHVADGVTVRPAGQVYPLAMTQERWKADSIGQQGTAERLEHLVSEMTLAEFAKLPMDWREGAQGAKPEQLWKGYAYDEHKWGMAIDLQKCIGCNACVVACQAENNVPVVGRDQVRRRRQMQWLRIDRYFRDESGNPPVTFQPMFCVHCENAPCESVCPVAATLHNEDGLNQMVYNRCVGTRYCSNNCPYKVRRFNFYHYMYRPPMMRRMQFNPNVTVRSRGVMEKCTYCVQRIQAAKIAAKNERRGIADGEFTTACGQACPTGAIVFGDLNDPNSRVAQLQRDRRSYAVLAELNTRPRSLHMARVRNPG